jgi:hypothetical protein
MFRCLVLDLIEEASLHFNDVLVTRLTSVQLDFWTGFTVSASKRAGYDTMTGHIPSLNEPYIAYNGFSYGDGETAQNWAANPQVFAAGTRLIYGRDLPETVINVPLPFFFNYTYGIEHNMDTYRHFDCVCDNVFGFGLHVLKYVFAFAAEICVCIDKNVYD